MNRLLLLGAIEEKETVGTAMLDAVLAEMASDQARGASKSPSPLSIEPKAAQPASEPGIDSVPAGEVAALLAQRDARTAELEAAISELQAAGRKAASAGAAAAPQVDDALDRIEARLEEQERSFRHVLAMLIEWLEDDKSREAA
jgi:hypothetical protein